MTNTWKARILVSAQFLLLGVIGIAATAHTNSKVHSYVVFELVLVALGIAVLLFAWMALRPSLQISPLPKEGSIFISRGIYRYVRHPMYLGVILVGFGLSGFADSLIGWICEMLLIFTLNMKANFEDGLLRERYSQAFHYQRHTAKILPCLGSSCRNDCEFRI